LPLARVLATGDWVAPLRHAQADYLRPLRLGVSFCIELAGAHVEHSEISLGWIIRSEDGAHAVVQTVHAFLDPATLQRVPVPQELAEALRSIA
jgi:acyl-CoA thioesterase FadM